MKAYTLTAVVALSMVMFQPVFAQSADVVAIKAVIERETASSLKGDTKTMATCWADVPEAGLIYVVPDGKCTISYTPKFPATIKTTKAGRKSSPDTFKNTGYQIRVNGNAAFAQFDQVESAPNGEKGYLHETRYLEKIGGAWKIIHVGAWFYKATK